MEQGRERYIVAGKLVEPAKDILLSRVEISADILSDPFEQRPGRGRGCTKSTQKVVTFESIEPRANQEKRLQKGCRKVS